MHNKQLARQIFLLFTILGCVPLAQSADQALLIGVDDYLEVKPPLPGIDLDLSIMRETAGWLGFDQITELHGKQATLGGIRLAFKQLAAQVGPKDRVLIYFSGHGSSIPDQNNDEDDALDEVWLPYNTKLKEDDGGQRLENVLVDDEVDGLLKQIASDNILVVLDACHSGTATKALVLKPQGVLGEVATQPKVYEYRRMPLAPVDGKPKGGAENSNVVTFSAAEDDETSLATPKGSVFTLGLNHAVKSFADAGRGQVKLAELQDSVAQYINATAKKPFHPQVSMADKLIRIRPTPPVASQDGQDNSRWQTIFRYAQRFPNLAVTANKKAYVINQDSLELDMELPFDGYLNIINIDSSDTVTVLFPNEFQHDNQVKAGRLHFPSEDMPFNLPASEQVGQVLTVVLLSRGPLDTYAGGTGSLDDKGVVSHQFRQFSAKSMADIKQIILQREAEGEQSGNANLGAVMGVVQTEIRR